MTSTYCRPEARFTKYLTIYRKVIIVYRRSSYDSDLKSAKISFTNIVS